MTRTTKRNLFLIMPVAMAVMSMSGLAFAQSSSGSGENPATSSVSGPSVKPGGAPIGQRNPNGNLTDPNCTSSSNGNCTYGNVNNDHAGDTAKGRTDRPQTKDSSEKARQ